MDALTPSADARRPAGAATTKHPVTRQGLGPYANGGEHADGRGSHLQRIAHTVTNAEARAQTWRRGQPTRKQNGQHKTPRHPSRSGTSNDSKRACRSGRGNCRSRIAHTVIKCQGKRHRGEGGSETRHANTQEVT